MGRITRKNIAGALYGLAIGDALGRDTEFMQLKQIHQAFGTSGPMNLSSPALFTDDTQMTLAVARALAQSHTVAPLPLERTLTVEFVDWMRHDARRAPGATCIQAVGRLQSGHHWRQATVTTSKGCGANMRVAPVAFLQVAGDVANVAQLQAAMTHGHPTALAASELTAWSIRWAAQGRPLTALPKLLWNYAIRQRDEYRRDWLGGLNLRWNQKTMIDGWDECLMELLKLLKALEDPNTAINACSVTGEGWVAETALTAALYCSARYDDPLEAVSMAARTSGDSDSIACVTGALVGAAHGLDAWPIEWCARMERADEIHAAIDALWLMHRGRDATHVPDQRSRPNVDKWVTAPAISRTRQRRKSRTSWTSERRSDPHNLDTSLFDAPPTDEDRHWSDVLAEVAEAETDAEADQLIDDLTRSLDELDLVPDGTVIRRKDGSIDHGFCDHDGSKNARRRCQRKHRDRG